MVFISPEDHVGAHIGEQTNRVIVSVEKGKVQRVWPPALVPVLVKNSFGQIQRLNCLHQTHHAETPTGVEVIVQRGSLPVAVYFLKAVYEPRDVARAAEFRQLLNIFPEKGFEVGQTLVVES